MTNYQLFIWLAFSLVFSGIAVLNVFPAASAQLSDRLFTEQALTARITIFKIDDASLNALGQWPFPRATFADIIDRLDNAAVIGIDIHFREASRLGEDDDRTLEEALLRSRTPVVFPAEIDAAGNLILPLSRFAQHAFLGFSNIAAGHGGVVRMIAPESPALSSFSHAVSNLYADEAAEGGMEPLTIRFHGANNTYPSFSILDLLLGTVPEQFIEGKIALVGVTASDVRNFYLTPFGFMSGIEIQANAVDTLLTGIRYTSSVSMTALAVFFLSLLTVLASVHIRNFFFLLLVLFGIATLYTMGALIAFDRFFILDLFYPLLAIIGVALLFNTFEYIAIARRESFLRQSFAHLNAMVESMHEGIIMVDKEFRIVVLNPAAQKLSGAFSAESNRHIREFARMLPPKLSLETRVKKSILRDKISVENEVFIADKFYQMFVAPVKHGGDILGSVIIFHDITPQKEVERIREDFTSMMVHELRSPVDAMKKIAEAILAKKVTPRKKYLYQKYISLIHENSAQILTLVNDLLDVAKIEAGKFEVEKRAANIEKTVSGRIRFFKEEYKAADVALSLHITRPLPPKVRFDERRIIQVLNNLLSNALKFTPANGAVAVHMFQHKNNASLKTEMEACSIPHALKAPEQKIPAAIVVAVSDTGAGIREKDRAQLFNKFKQLSPEGAREAHGTGLGLAIVKGIVEAHGGMVGVLSKREQGSTFYFTIPD